MGQMDQPLFLNTNFLIISRSPLSAQFLQQRSARWKIPDWSQIYCFQYGSDPKHPQPHFRDGGLNYEWYSDI